MPTVRSTTPSLPKPGQRWPVAASRANSWALMVEEMMRRLQSGAAPGVAAAFTAASAAAGATGFGAGLAAAFSTRWAAGAGLAAGVGAAPGLVAAGAAV